MARHRLALQCCAGLCDRSDTRRDRKNPEVGWSSRGNPCPVVGPGRFRPHDSVEVEGEASYSPGGVARHAGRRRGPGVSLHHVLATAWSMVGPGAVDPRRQRMNSLRDSAILLKPRMPWESVGGVGPRRRQATRGSTIGARSWLIRFSRPHAADDFQVACRSLPKRAH